MLRRGSSSKKKGKGAEEPVAEEPMMEEAAAEAPAADLKLDKKAAKKKAAAEKAAAKKAAKEKAAEEKAAKKVAKKSKKEPLVEEVGAGAPRGVLVRRPKASIYTVMLGITAGALAVGCLMLVLEIWTYGAPWTFPWNIPINLR